MCGAVQQINNSDTESHTYRWKQTLEQTPTMLVLICMWECVLRHAWRASATAFTVAISDFAYCSTQCGLHSLVILNIPGGIFSRLILLAITIVFSRGSIHHKVCVFILYSWSSCISKNHFCSSARNSLASIDCSEL